MPQHRAERRSYLGRQVGTLALASGDAESPMALVQAAAWHNQLHRLGLDLPLFAIADIGQLICRGALVTGKNASMLHEMLEQAGLEALFPEYEALLEQMAGGELVRSSAALRLRDELVAVILHRLLKDLVLRWPERRAWAAGGACELPLDPGVYQAADPAELFGQFDAKPLLSFLSHLVQHRLYLLTAVEQIDLDTLRLLGLFQREGRDGDLLDLADLLAVFSSPQANDVVNFSLDLLPSVLETRRQSGVQVFSIDGYASLERRGGVDSVVLSEFAYDRDIFELKVLDNELYYYGHEKERQEQRNLQYILVDCSASMRGEREVFARGLALTLIKKFSLRGDEVWLRFFDSRLHELMRAGEAGVPQLLCFRSERGRNYGRVFRQLLLELTRQQRGPRRDVVLYFITHGQCHIPAEVVEPLARLVRLYGVFVLPSQELDLDYLPLLHRHQIVTREALATREGSVDRALQIVDDAGLPR